VPSPDTRSSGIPALSAQVATGLWLAQRLVQDAVRRASFGDPLGCAVGDKLGLLAAAAVRALDERPRIIPRLSPGWLPLLAWHIVPVIVISVPFLVAGVTFRTGGLGS